MNLSKLLCHFILVLCLFIELTFSQTFPQSVIKNMATRQMRYHHYMWHQIRDNWNSFSSSTKAAFTKIGWSCPNPARDSSGDMITNNYSGEDFLYMHRHMISTAKSTATANGDALGTWFTGWTSIPAPGDKSYPVPSKSDLSSYKTTSYYNTLKSLETQFKDASKLKKMTLAQLGSQLESKIHNALHLRWAGSNSVGYRSGGSASSGVPNIAKKWDSATYNYLADTYSSHVNPIFWKLHGWIDDRVEDWRKAHGLTSIKWSGTWIGGPMTSLGSALNRMKMGMTANDTDADPEAVGDVLEEAMNLLSQSGVVEWTFEDALKKDNMVKSKKGK